MYEAEAEEVRRETRPGWEVWFLWVIATVGSTFAGGWLMSWLFHALGVTASTTNDVIGALVALAVLGFLTGFITGLAQWFVLQRYVSRLRWQAFALATGAGSAAAILSIVFLVWILLQPLIGVGQIGILCLWIAVSVLLGISGSLIGWAQRRVLKQYLEDDRGFWGCSYFLGWALAFMLTFLFTPTFGANLGLNPNLLGLPQLIIISCVTGLAAGRFARDASVIEL